jgi:nucleotide-binding universal stress UspA family protein
MGNPQACWGQGFVEIKESAMKETMKILIAYDGSQCADFAIDDLQRAGLPAEAEALVVSIEEGWAPAPPMSSYELVERVAPSAGSAATQMAYEVNPRLSEAKALALKAKAEVKKIFPGWKVSESFLIGLPANEILKIADEWHPDLIVVGSHGRTALGRFIFGSVSNRIVTHAACSVRVSRCESENPYGKERILIGIDGSLGAEAAVEELMHRKFPAGTDVRLIIACDPLRPSLVGYLMPKVIEWVDESNRGEKEWASDVVRQQAERLKHMGLHLSYEVKQGDPRRVLMEEAEDWQATSIFIGARGLAAIERFLLGSVSATVAQRAECTVEVVRQRPKG